MYNIIGYGWILVYRQLATYRSVSLPFSLKPAKYAGCSEMAKLLNVRKKIIHLNDFMGIQCGRLIE